MNARHFFFLALLLLLVAACTTASAEKAKKKRRDRSILEAASLNSPSSGLLSRQGGSIDITGTVKVKVVPDVSHISLTVETSDVSSATAAYSANNVLVKKVVKAIQSSGVDAKDVQTSDLSLAPVYSYDGNKRKMDGWRAAQELLVRVRDIGKTSSVLDAVLGSSPLPSSPSLLTVNQVSLSVLDPKKYTTDARAAAVKDAQEKATALCSLLGVRLGKPTAIRESEVGSEAGGLRRWTHMSHT